MIHSHCPNFTAFMGQRLLAAGPLADDSPANHPLEIPAPPDAPDPDAAALADYCHVLLNSNAFLYVD